MEEKKKSGAMTQIIVAVVIALLAGGSAPWWWNSIFGKTPPPPSSSPTSESIDRPTQLSIQKYLMDNQQNRVIVMTHLQDDEYRIEEPSSPWPWTGTATLDGGKLSGQGQFRGNLTTMKVEGIVRRDRSIEIQYIFLTDDKGKPDPGRVDKHVWYPTN